jgi:hypothetical protein
VCGVIFAVSVHVVNIEKIQYLNIPIAVKGLMCQTDFLHDQNPGSYVSRDIRGLVAFIPQIVVSLAMPW